MKLIFMTILLTIIISIVYLDHLTNKLDSNSHFAILIWQQVNKKLRPLFIKNVNSTTKTYAKLKNIKYNFIDRYKRLLSCNLENYPTLSINDLNNYENLSKIDYSTKAPKRYHKMRITRAMIVHFPIEYVKVFKLEFKWLYRSWLEMQKSESNYWRTDLIVFISRNSHYFKNSNFFLFKLNCSFENKRKSRFEKPMCILIDYEPLKKRKVIKKLKISINNHDELFQQFLTKVNILSTDKKKFKKFYSLLKTQIANYKYIDSILIAFEGYNHFKSGGYDFLIRSDMDVFLTPYFGKWLPKNCNDFYVGRGRYSTIFNLNRLNRVARNIKFETASQVNLGSTWYSGVDQFRLVSYLTLLSMCILSVEEFTPIEKSGILGVRTWPNWHYGVLSLYGQSLAMNHLIRSKQMNIVKLANQLDYPTHSNVSVSSIIAIHAYHTGSLFSKYEFKSGKYDYMINKKFNLNIVKNYALKMALEAKYLSYYDIKMLLRNIIMNKK